MNTRGLVYVEMGSSREVRAVVMGEDYKELFVICHRG